MPERIPDRFIVKQVQRMVQDGMDVDLDGQYGRFRVTNRAGHTNLSPRLPNREMADWLDGYRQGWEAGRAFQFSKMRKEGMDAMEGMTVTEGNCAAETDGSGGT